MLADEAIEALSEKEREALRLLLAGYDAKASAQKLGVSHHAIHDRLRRARLKLGTAGSRQAALLLSESEKVTPNFIVHKQFGDEATAAFLEHPSSADLKRPGYPWAQRRNKGLIIMSVSILIVAAAIAISSPAELPRTNAEAAAARPPRAGGDPLYLSVSLDLDGDAPVLAAGEHLFVSLIDETGTVVSTSTATAAERRPTPRVAESLAVFPDCADNRAYTLTGEIRTADGTVRYRAEPATIRLEPASCEAAGDLSLSLSFRPV